jgi:hypothetical protein
MPHTSTTDEFYATTIRPNKHRERMTNVFLQRNLSLVTESFDYCESGFQEFTHIFYIPHLNQSNNFVFKLLDKFPRTVNSMMPCLRGLKLHKKVTYKPKVFHCTP